MRVKTLRPVMDWLLIERLGLEGATALTVDGLNESLRVIGVVKEQGTGKIVNGKLFPLAAQRGQQVLLPPNAGIKITLEGKEHILLQDQYVLGVITTEQTEFERMEEDLLSTPTSDEEKEQQKAVREILGKDVDIIKVAAKAKVLEKTEPKVEAPVEQVANQNEDKSQVQKDETKNVKQTVLPPLPKTQKKVPIKKGDSKVIAAEKLLHPNAGQSAQKDKVG